MDVLVAGIGNIFLSDDGFGVEVVNRLRDRPVPHGVRVADFGIRGVHLAYELLDGCDVLVLVDALPLSEPPGTVAVIEVDPGDIGGPGGPGGHSAPVIEAHSMTPATVLGMLQGLGGRVGRVYVVGCQPASLEEGIGLSPTVAAAVDHAVAAVTDLVADLRADAEARKM